MVLQGALVQQLWRTLGRVNIFAVPSSSFLETRRLQRLSMSEVPGVEGHTVESTLPVAEGLEPPAKRPCLEDSNKVTLQESEFAEVSQVNNSSDGVDVTIEGTTSPEDVGVVTKRPPRRKKCAVLMSYSGKGYLGMQRNPGVRTIEEDLINAMAKAEVFPPDMVKEVGSKLRFQRCARTDKGVSAARQLVSLKHMVVMDNAPALINAHLPDQIRVMAVKRVTKAFDCRHACNARMYEYILPTYTLAPYHHTTRDYRITDERIALLDKFLARYQGTHNFHNFTSGHKFEDMAARRYIISFKSGEKFMAGDTSDPSCKPMEFIPLRVKGQSFVLHQIRKMIGFVIAIIRGFLDESKFELSFERAKVDIPRVPSLGLLLDNIYFDHYNAKFANSGERERLEWGKYDHEVQTFKHKYIYHNILDTEMKELPMMQWLHTLQVHNFYSTVEREKALADLAGTEATAEQEKVLAGTEETANDDVGIVGSSTDTVKLLSGANAVDNTVKLLSDANAVDNTVKLLSDANAVDNTVNDDPSVNCVDNLNCIQGKDVDSRVSAIDNTDTGQLARTCTNN